MKSLRKTASGKIASCCYDSWLVAMTSRACLGQILVYLETRPFTTRVQYKGLGIARLGSPMIALVLTPNPKP